MKFLKLNVSMLLVFLISAINPTLADGDPHVRDLKILANWFEGEFDNDSQLWFEARGDWTGTKGEEHGRIHATHVRIEDSSLGKYAFYVEEYMDDDPTNIGRQRIVSFATDPEEGGIRMKIYFLRDAKSFIGAQDSAALLTAVTEEDLFGLDGCDVIFKRHGEQYHGSMKDKECQFGEGDLKRYSVHDMIISKNQYWRVDRTFLVKDDSFHKGHPNSEPHKMRKVQNYVCDVSFYETAYYAPSEKDKKYKGVIIHNQGGSEVFKNPIDGKEYLLQIREKEYPFYEEGSDFLMLRFKEVGQLASNIIVTATPGTKYMSFTQGTESASCKLQN